MMITDEESIICTSTDVNDSDKDDPRPYLQGIVERGQRLKTKNIMAKRQLAMGYHHEKIQVLPQLWQFPKMKAKQLIENWYVGNVRDKVPSFALLSHHNVAHLGITKIQIMEKLD